ncbi:MAG TPA: YeeE/YedE family protein, partial [Chitinophagaceae bacterium]
MLNFLKEPWPWYIAGPLIGLTVPALLLLGNKSFGVSASFRHICAACFPGRVSFFRYDWKKEIWNLFFAAGILLGGFVVYLFLQDPNPVQVNPKLVDELQQYGISNYNGLAPADLFNWENLLTLKGIIMMVGGGSLIGF